jgi:hypothetical protein
VKSSFAFQRGRLEKTTLKNIHCGSDKGAETGEYSSGKAGFGFPLWIRCFPFHIERVLDKPLHNASNAIPEEGGELSVQSYRKDPWPAGRDH